MRLRRFAVLLLVPAALAAAYLCFWPIPIEPRSWNAPDFAGYVGPHATNQRLASLQQVSIAPYEGPEHVEFGPDGRLYTGTLSGEILRMEADGSGLAVLANTRGRPLGLAFDASGRLLVADALRGLLAVQPDGTVSVLVDRFEDRPILYADAVVVAPDGRVYFTDASQRSSPAERGTFDAALLDVLEHSCTGRVLTIDPASGVTELLIGGLCFPNGLALSGDARRLFVAETGEYRIWKIDVSARGLDAGANDPRAQVLLSNLPGFPDNLSRGDAGRIWVGLTKPRSAIVDALARHPFLRGMTLRLPRSLWPVPPSYGHVLAFDEDGQVLADLQDPTGALPETSGATEHAGRLFVQSLHAAAFGVLPVTTGTGP